MCFLLMSYQHSKVLPGARGFLGKLSAVRPQGLLNCRGLINPRYFENLSLLAFGSSIVRFYIFKSIELLFAYKRFE